MSLSKTKVDQQGLHTPILLQTHSDCQHLCHSSIKDSNNPDPTHSILSMSALDYSALDLNVSFQIHLKSRLCTSIVPFLELIKSGFHIFLSNNNETSVKKVEAISNGFTNISTKALLCNKVVRHCRLSIFCCNSCRGSSVFSFCFLLATSWLFCFSLRRVF